MFQNLTQLGEIISNNSFFRQIKAVVSSHSDISRFWRSIDNDQEKKSSTSSLSQTRPQANNKDKYDILVDNLLNNQETQNWINVAQSLQILSDILKPFMVEKMNLLYNHMMYVILNGSDGNGGSRSRAESISSLSSPQSSPRVKRLNNDLGVRLSPLSASNGKGENLLKLDAEQHDKFLRLAYSLDKRKDDHLATSNADKNKFSNITTNNHTTTFRLSKAKKPKNPQTKIPKNIKDRNITASAVNLANAYIMMSVMKNNMDGAFDQKSFQKSKKSRNEDISFNDFDTPSVLHVIRNCEIFDDFWTNGAVDKMTMINQVIFIRNKVIHSNLKVESYHAKLAIEIILHLCKSFRIEGYKDCCEGNIADLKQLDHSQSSIAVEAKKQNSEANPDVDPSTTDLGGLFASEKYKKDNFQRNPKHSIKMIEAILKKYDKVEKIENPTGLINIRPIGIKSTFSRKAKPIWGSRSASSLSLHQKNKKIMMSRRYLRKHKNFYNCC